jgi:hypothetical protein
MTVEEFKTALPAFEETDEPTIQRHLDRVPAYFNKPRWDFLSLYDEGVKFWVAHEIVLEANVGATMATAGASALAVKKKVGSVEVQYPEAILNLLAENEYMRTTYGQRYWRLARQVGAGGAVA